jgi:gamma-glutamyltranspeptidase/glutathione hydrolase/leukotriene-C4 hydrolase
MMHCAAAVVVVILVIGVVVMITRNTNGGKTGNGYDKLRSATAFYSQAAVASDNRQCSDIGRGILSENGSAVDAAIATMLCCGVHSAHSSGIGGGFIMVVYDTARGETTKQMVAVDAREVAPASAATFTFPPGVEDIHGGPSIAVPSEVLGYYEAWRRFGRLPWRRLFQPTIDMCRNGYAVSPSLAQRIDFRLDLIAATPSLRQIFLKEDGSAYREGDLMRRPRLADTLETISAVDDVETLYTELGQRLIDDLQELGANITMSDLRDYNVRVYPTLSMSLRSGQVLHTLRPPSSGAILGMMLRILEGFNLTAADSAPDNVDTYQKLLETFKFGYAMRTYLADEQFADIAKTMANITSFDFADYLRGRINVSHTQDIAYYNSAFVAPFNAAGTSHLSILAADGSAVSMTSTINNLFGSRVAGSRTGILFNDEMNDFWWPGQFTYRTNVTSPVDLPNAVQPGKRPRSAMCPAVVVNGNGNVTMVIGAAGGPYIAAATTFVMAGKLWLGRSLSEAVDQLRLYHRLVPHCIEYDQHFPTAVLNALQTKGHQIRDAPIKGLSVVQAVYSSCDTNGEPAAVRDVMCIEAVCDWRKSGAPSGF